MDFFLYDHEIFGTEMSLFGTIHITRNMGGEESNTSASRLLHLQAARDAKETAILAERGSRLFEIEWNIGGDALAADVEHPIVITDAGITARFPAYRHLLNPRAKAAKEVNVFQQRFTDDGLVLQRQFAEYRQSLIHSPLVLHCAGDSHVIVARTPILGQTLENPLWSFGNDVEMQVAPAVNHQPRFLAPLVSLFDEEVAGEARPHQRTRRYLPIPTAVTTDGKIERCRLRHDIGVLLKLRVAPKHVAVPTALALLMATVP